MANIKLWSRDLFRIGEEFLNSVSHFIKLGEDYGYVMTVVDRENSNQTYVYGEKVCQWLSMEHDPERPQLIPALSGKPIKKIDRGYLFFAALTYDGDVYLCSSDPRWKTHGDLILIKSNGIKNIVCGGFHLFLLRNNANNGMFAQGSNKHGQLGNGSNDDSFDTYINAGIENIFDVCCGESHCLAWTQDNRLYSWGANIHGQLGLNHYGGRNVPSLINLGIVDQPNARIKQISAGRMFSAVLMSNGTMFIWGTFTGNAGFAIPKRIELNGIKFLASNNLYNRLFASTRNFGIFYNWIQDKIDPQIKFDQTAVDRSSKIKSFAEAYAKIYLDIDNYPNTIKEIDSSPLTFGWTKNKAITDTRRSFRWSVFLFTIMHRFVGASD